MQGDYLLMVPNGKANTIKIVTIRKSQNNSGSIKNFLMFFFVIFNFHLKLQMLYFVQKF